MSERLCGVCHNPIYNAYYTNISWGQDAKKAGVRVIGTSICINDPNIDPYEILEEKYGYRPIGVSYEITSRASLCRQCKQPYHYDCVPGGCTKCGSVHNYNCDYCAPGYCPGEC